ncbi:hypothetical protein Lal_00012727, partial [Lupinus albus]
IEKMKKENIKVVDGNGEEEHVMRMTRARARIIMGGVSASSKPPFKKKEPNSKRDTTSALTDVTNLHSTSNFNRPSTFQARGGYKKKNTNLAPDVSKQEEKLAEDSSTIADPLLSLDQPMTPLQIKRERRVSSDYMDKLQHDITPGMRGILVDWLVEVSPIAVAEEYNLVPDTLYLTVNLIDRFLSASLIQRQRLQLLGVTCMLISSKYEEMKAPQVKEFCVITDNAYTKAEVVKMEKEVLKLLHFQLSIPTTKTFLRRFIQAAQSSYKVPYVELEFLANYLAELTLVEYSFLQFLPSMIAASAVLLARWTLIHSEHPWNPTMEHYTNYKVSQLKTTVLALADLQLNTNASSLNAVREKYKQQKVRLMSNSCSLLCWYNKF